MKFEFKTDNENYFKSFEYLFGTIFRLALIIIFCNVASKVGVISRHYKIDHECRLLSIEKSKSKFDKLSRLSNLKTKQRIWEFCRQVVK